MSNWIEIEDSNCKTCFDAEAIVTVVYFYPSDGNSMHRIKTYINNDPNNLYYLFVYPFCERQKAEAIFNKLYELKKAQKVFCNSTSEVDEPDPEPESK